MTTKHLMSSPYAEIFFSEGTASIMREGRILPESGSVGEMLSDLIIEIARAERGFGTKDRDADELITDFYEYVRQGLCVLGSPLLTNIAAKHPVLASCSAVPVSPEVSSDADLGLAERYYNLNMGSGYDLTSTADPCGALLRLNDHARRVEASGTCERYVGNIAHLSVNHPRIFDFASVKADRSDVVHFNISIDLTQRFVDSVKRGGTFHTLDGVQHSSTDLWETIIDSAWRCGDPGILSLDRYNAGNALAAHSPYVTTAPCAEVGLSPGEVCVFGYINLAACVVHGPRPGLDLDLVGDVAECLTRVLDDALELSLVGAPSESTASVAAAKRKIGIGVCGFADAILWLGMDYGGVASASVLRDALATINHRSKVASHRLSRERGPFGNFILSAYATDPSLLTRFAIPGSCVGADDWSRLACDVMANGLRNVMTTALPPSGRSALLLGVNPSIEPYLTLRNGDGWVLPIAAHLADGSVMLDRGSPVCCPTRSHDWSSMAASVRSLFRTSTEIAMEDHLRLLVEATRLVDDGVSKTINLPHSATRQDVSDLYLDAWDAGVKAISVFRVRDDGKPE